MEYLITCLVAFIGSSLTLFSGFGLGTLLIPAFALFFPIDVTIALTAIVHFLNNIFKLVLLGKHANRDMILRFGIPSVIAALAGAYLLTSLVHLHPIASYSLQEKLFFIVPVKIIIGILMIFFALFDIVPALANIQLDKKYLPLGGLLSGFIGGLSGHQGALRSAFLIRANLSKETFIASGVVIACLTDISRLTVYAEQIFTHQNEFNYPLIIAATLAAFAGAYLGNHFIKKVTVKAVQNIVAVMLIVFGVLLGIGII